jgi:hypothetical protein
VLELEVRPPRRRADGVGGQDPALGHQTKLRWNDRSDWVWSAQVTHEAIISPEDFARAQDMRGQGVHRAATPKERKARRTYVLSRLVGCGLCGRSMQAHTAHDRARYRCRYPSEYAATKELDHPRNVFVREDAIVPKLDAWIATMFDPTNLDATCDALAMAQEVDDAAIARAAAARRKIADCDDRLSKYRNALEAGADAAIVGGWIAEVRAERERAEADIEGAKPAEPITRDEVKAIVLQGRGVRRPGPAAHLTPGACDCGRGDRPGPLRGL